MAKLTDIEIAAVLDQHPRWRLEDGAFVRDWTFQDFAEAMIFVNKVAEVAEEVDHHPDIDIRYNKVRLAFISHDAGGLTKRDVNMVNRIDTMNA